MCHINFSSGPAEGKFCWDKQPEWSAFRESSFGHGMLEVVNSTYALWTWHRNQDIYKDDSHGDQIYVVRQPELCNASTLEGGGKPEDGGGLTNEAADLLARWTWFAASIEMLTVAVIWTSFY